MGTTNHLEVRGIYGGAPTAPLADYGANAVWIGSSALTHRDIDRLRNESALIFAEFNTMHHAAFLADHPDAAPIGRDGQVCPPPDGWQGVCPTHPGYRRNQMETFAHILATFDLDGIWLDYHHSHASWEQADPKLPDTCFCPRCIARFQAETNTEFPAADDPWTAWRCGIFTDWVREFREIRDVVRPSALLGTFHCPWTDTERDGALTGKLSIDLRAQREHIDVFSPMPYHARFGHGDDVGWIARQVAWLGQYLAIAGQEPGPAMARGSKCIWPIVQLSDWGEPTIPASQVAPVLAAGARLPATGITVFNWGSLQKHSEKITALSAFYRAATAGEQVRP